MIILCNILKNKAYPEILNSQLLNSFLATKGEFKNPVGLHLK